MPGHLAHPMIPPAASSLSHQPVRLVTSREAGGVTNDGPKWNIQDRKV